MNHLNNNDSFQEMDPQKREMLLLLIRTLQDKKLTEALPLIMNWKRELQQKKLSFTAEENALLTSILAEQMTPEQKRQYEALQMMMHSREQ